MPFELPSEKRNNTIAVRLSDEELALLRRFGEQLSAQYDGREFSGSDVVREALRVLSETLPKTGDSIDRGSGQKPQGGGAKPKRRKK
ncbi:MAG TPA: hypothetical protein PKI03_02175 [Pseudomonadota bacterium]|nr:hypothetical protein [Pseudomonadota bacterium]